MNKLFRLLLYSVSPHTTPLFFFKSFQHIIAQSPKYLAIVFKPLLSNYICWVDNSTGTWNMQPVECHYRSQYDYSTQHLPYAFLFNENNGNAVIIARESSFLNIFASEIWYSFHYSDSRGCLIFCCHRFTKAILVYQLYSCFSTMFDFLNNTFFL